MRGGFTLVEIILVVAIIAITAAATAPVYQSFQSRNDLEVAVNAIPPALRRAQVLAQAPDGDTSWGVRIQSGTIVVFQGASYAARNTTLDEVTDITSTITPSGLAEVVFTKFTGLPNTTGTITLTNVNGTIRNITVNGKGMIEY